MDQLNSPALMATSLFSSGLICSLVDAMQAPLQQKAAELRAAIKVAGNVTDSTLIVGNQNRAVRSDIYIEHPTRNPACRIGTSRI